MNDDANLTYAGEARDFGRLSLPVLFLHGLRDPVCEKADRQITTHLPPFEGENEERPLAGDC